MLILPFGLFICCLSFIMSPISLSEKIGKQFTDDYFTVVSWLSTTGFLFEDSAETYEVVAVSLFERSFSSLFGVYFML